MNGRPDELERLAIEWACSRLIHLYANLNDSGDWEAVANLYTEDGIFARPAAPDQLICGRARILEAFKARPSRTTRHVCSNVVIEVIDQKTALGESVMLLFTSAAAPIVGGFRDRFLRTQNGWRFAERVGSVSFAP